MNIQAQDFCCTNRNCSAQKTNKGLSSCIYIYIYTHTEQNENWNQNWNVEVYSSVANNMELSLGENITKLRGSKRHISIC